MKRCRKCSLNKNFTEFSKAKKNKDGLDIYCKECTKALCKAWYAKNPHKKKEYYLRKPNRYDYNKNHNLKKYGLSLEDYKTLVMKQNNCCAICLKPESAIDTRTNKIRPLAVDHCHKTGKIRKLLCGSCNGALGLFKDNIANLKRAVDYLEVATCA